MAGIGLHVAVAAGCSVFGFAAGVAGDLLRQRLGTGKVAARAEVVPDVEQSNLQASFLEPCSEASLQTGASHAAKVEQCKDSSKEADGSFSTVDSVGHAYAIADALPYGAANDEASPQGALADAVPYVAAGTSAAAAFVPDLSKCLPGCLNPAEGVHHVKCPNHGCNLRAERVVVEAAEPEEPMLKESVRKTGGMAMPYCQSFERKAMPYMD